MTMAESTSRRNFSAVASSPVTMQSVWWEPKRSICARGVDAVDEFRRNDGVEISGRPILVGRGEDAGIGGARRGVAAHLAAGVEQARHQRREQAVGGGGVDQQRSCRAADAAGAAWSWSGSWVGHVEIGGAVDIDMHDAFEMREDRHARLVLHPRHRALRRAAR